ncbi:MAG: NAD(P)-dependent oxidoreductase [Candidatus Peribacter sp.]|nr:NAD(P)-dependent oxidoreductase [Candidatus Peribacter sp.]
MKIAPQYRGDITPTGDLEPFRVAARDKVSSEAVRLLTERPHIEVTDDPTVTQAAIIRSATKYLTEGDLEAYQHLMYVARAGVGVDNIAMPLAAERGIATVNTPGASTDAVARRSLAHILSWASRVVQGTDALRKAQWPKNQPEVEPIDLSEKTLGIIGYGRIGRKTKEFAAPHFGRILYTDVRPVEGATDLETLLREADVVSINVSGKEEVLTSERIVTMKPTALIVNTARGTVVNTAALLQHLDQGGAAALDVYPKEGATMFEIPEVQGLTQHPNFLGTPHTAAADPVTQKKLGIEAAQRVIEFAEEGTVNPGNLPGHTLPRVSLRDTPSEDDNGNGGGNGSSEDQPRTRFVLTHPSVPGVLRTVTGIVAEAGENITGLDTKDGKIPTEPRLAMTMFDIPEQQIPKILAIRRKIEEALHPHRMRTLALGSE